MCEGRRKMWCSWEVQGRGVAVWGCLGTGAEVAGEGAGRPTVLPAGGWGRDFLPGRVAFYFFGAVVLIWEKEV